jgi:putative hydrolase of the HAD superfamily
MTRAVLFDVFGTLIRFSEGRRPFTSAMRELSFDRQQKLTARELLMTRDLPTLSEAIQALEALAPGRSLSQRSRDLAQDELDAHQAGCELVEGALELLEALAERGTRTALVSNLSSLYVPLVKRLGLHERVDHALYSCEVGLQKPDPAIFKLALEALGASSSASVMVGDSLPSDIRGAAAAGLSAIWISAGDAAGAQCRVATFQDAASLLQDP